MRWRRRLLSLLALGFVGTGAELVLLDQTEGFWQKAPLVVIAFSLVALALCAYARSIIWHRLFQVAMVLSLAGGVAGLILHFLGNLEFEKELHPDIRGLTQVWNTLKGAFPALAPGMMILLGLLGLAAGAPLTTPSNYEQQKPI